MEYWADYADDPDFVEEFQKVIDHPDIPEADSHTPEVLDDTYVNMELALDRGGDGPAFVKVKNGLEMLMDYLLELQMIILC